MIVLDTNVISEFMKPSPSKTVLEWVNSYDTMLLYITSISIAEINYGLNMMPSGNRKQLLQIKFEGFMQQAFGHRILSFDASAAKMYGSIMASRTEIVRPMSMADGQIAAITKTNLFSLATRNCKDFDFCDLLLINPFKCN